jgi:hypothetical protein
MNATPEISPAPNYWDGESIIIGQWTDEGLPTMIPPADHKVPEYNQQPSRSVSTIAEDLDRKCSEAEYNNGWYR